MNKTHISIEEVIISLNLKPHIEGGYGATYFEDQGIIHGDSLPSQYGGKERPISNGIYFLVPKSINTCLHRITMNEIWHFCMGSPIEIHEILSDGTYQVTVLGQDIMNGEKLLHVVQSGSWFGSCSQGAYSLITCTTAPGFTMDDFEEADREYLLKMHPELKDLILRFTR